MPEAKPYDISKQLVWEAYQRVKGVLSAAVRDGSGGAALGSGPSTAINWRKPVHGTTRPNVEVCFDYG